MIGRCVISVNFHDINETVTYDKNIFHSRIIDSFSMLTIDSTTDDNNESTFSTGTNDLDNDTGPQTNLYSGQVEGAFGLFWNSIDANNITANISDSDW